MKKRLLLIFFFAIYIMRMQGQVSSNLIQFSGVVVTNDSLQPIPYTNVMIKSTHRGTVTDYFGFFSFVAMKGDTIEFNYIGYKKANFIIPDTLSEIRYSLIQVLVRDTITFKEAVIYPWPSKEEFKRVFVSNDELLTISNQGSTPEITLRKSDFKKIGFLEEKMS